MHANLRLLALLTVAVLLGSFIAPRRSDAGAFAPASVGWTTVTKSTNEARATNTTTTADSALLFTVSANTKYRFRIHAYYQTPAAADFKYSLSGPASPTLLCASARQAGAAGTVTNYAPWGSYATLTNFSSLGTGTSPRDIGYAWIDGVLHNGANAGSVTFDWSQDTSDASSTTVLAGSYVEYKAVP